MEEMKNNDWRKNKQYARLEARISKTLMDRINGTKGELSKTAFVKRALMFVLETHELLNDERVESLVNLIMPMHPDDYWSCTVVLKEGVNAEQFNNDHANIIKRTL